MNKKNLLLTVTILMVAMFWISFQGLALSASETPTNVVQSFLQAIMVGDYKKAESYITPYIRSKKDQFGETLVERWSNELRGREPRGRNFRLIEQPKIVGSHHGEKTNSYLVGITYAFEDVPGRMLSRLYRKAVFSLGKINGKWLISDCGIKTIKDLCFVEGKWLTAEEWEKRIEDYSREQAQKQAVQNKPSEEWKRAHWDVGNIQPAVRAKTSYIPLIRGRSMNQVIETLGRPSDRSRQPWHYIIEGYDTKVGFGVFFDENGRVYKVFANAPSRSSGFDPRLLDPKLIATPGFPPEDLSGSIGWYIGSSLCAVSLTVFGFRSQEEAAKWYIRKIPIWKYAEVPKSWRSIDWWAEKEA